MLTRNEAIKCRPDYTNLHVSLHFVSCLLSFLSLTPVCDCVLPTVININTKKNTTTSNNNNNSNQTHPIYILNAYNFILIATFVVIVVVALRMCDVSVCAWLWKFLSFTFTSAI